jgi:SAM-dependent methyltransferase
VTTLPFEPRRFRSTAAYYARFRIPYPPALLASIAARLAIEPGDRVLDLGCGPGMLALGFARLGMTAVAMDPEPDMLAEARAGAAEAGLALELVQGSSYDLGPHLGRFRLVTMGRSFHWMDRPATLQALDRLIVPGGALALFHDRSIASGSNWRSLARELAAKYVPERQSMRALRQGPDWQPHEVPLLDSAFSALESRGEIFTQELTADDLVGRAYSMSETSLDALGDHRAAFEQEFRSGLAALPRTDRFREIVSAEAIIAFRPGEAPAVG